MISKKRGNSGAGDLLDGGIQVGERDVGLGGDDGTDGGFAGPHEAAEQERAVKCKVTHLILFHVKHTFEGDVNSWRAVLDTRRRCVAIPPNYLRRTFRETRQRS